MAKNSKNVCVKVKKGAMNVLKGILGILFCAVVGICALAVLATSPVWVFYKAKKNPLDLATQLLHENDKGENWVETFINMIDSITSKIIAWVYMPIIRHMPMRVYGEFIRLGKLSVCSYPVQTQVEYFNSRDDKGKLYLLKSNSLSNEAVAKLWVENKEIFITAGKSLSDEQVYDMVYAGYTDSLWKYISAHTPNKAMIDRFIDQAGMGYQTAMEMLYRLAQQQKFEPELLARMLSVGDENFRQQLSELISRNSDIQAVTFSERDLMNDELSAKQLREIVQERWSNYCKERKEICAAAQKKMDMWQYEIFSNTGHHLHPGALQSLLLSISDSDYLELILKNELQRIDPKLQAALSTSYWRYSLYLAVKQEQEKSDAK